jgi:hypothetical protein
MNKKWFQYPLFLLLLPIFFVFHGYVENYYFMHFSDCGFLLAAYTGSAILLYLAGCLFLKDSTGAALLASILMSVYFFFGALHDFLRKNDIFLQKYSLLLPFLAIILILAAFYIKKKQSFRRFTAFLNSLLLLYMLLDAGTLVWKGMQKRQAPPVDYSLISTPVIRCDGCPRPDIYFILFDDYCNSKTLKDIYNYDNSGFDSFLVKEGFHIQQNSRSNYTSTPMSMASMLNYSYLGDLKGITFRGYTDMLDAIAKDRVVNFLYAEGYTAVNYSPFDLPGCPSGKELPLIPAKAKLITNRTLLNYLVRDLRGWVEKHVKDSLLQENSLTMQLDRLNTQALSGAKEESSKKTGSPRFIYAHLFLPHFPFMFDSLLHRRSLSDIAAHLDEDHPSYYLNYIPYVNACARDLITTIKKNTGGNAVIIFLSDHGFRYSPEGKIKPYMFDNQDAIYFPDKDYHLFYDSMSAVNLFPLLFNKLFRQHFSILKDSITYLTDKEL